MENLNKFTACELWCPEWNGDVKGHRKRSVCFLSLDDIWIAADLRNRILHAVLSCYPHPWILYVTDVPIYNQTQLWIVSFIVQKHWTGTNNTDTYRYTHLDRLFVRGLSGSRRGLAADASICILVAISMFAHSPINSYTKSKNKKKRTQRTLNNYKLNLTKSVWLVHSFA